ncbi:hypothetical protein ABZP36_031231 [Zizania latifolia]
MPQRSSPRLRTTASAAARGRLRAPPRSRRRKRHVAAEPTERGNVFFCSYTVYVCACVRA